MPCFHPMPVWRTQAGKIVFTTAKPEATAETIRLPCQKCLGCEQDVAKDWALRCSLESRDHLNNAWATLTYDEEHVPVTLNKRDLQLFLKNTRKRLENHKRKLRFFASGEYGETNFRPHYHVILFGMHEAEKETIDEAWKRGNTLVKTLSPALIAYTAGYTAKKLGWRQLKQETRIDYTTGEEYNWQPPFLQMSRGGRTGHGIGGNARQYTQSWKDYAVLNGTIQKVPRYLHEAWKKTATPEQIEELREERKKAALTRHITYEQLEAKEANTIAKQAQQAQRRPL